MAYKGLHDHRISFSFRELVFGIHDGILTVLGFVSGVAGIITSSPIIFLSGLVAIVAEGISMGVGEYQSSKTYAEMIEAEKSKEKKHIEEIPKIEEEEIFEIYKKKGFSDKETKRIARKIISDKSVWFQTMLAEEFGLGPKAEERPLKNAAIMGISSFFGGVVPIIPYAFLSVLQALTWSVILSALCLFIVGAAKTKYTKKNWLASGMKMVLIAMATALITYYIGQTFSIIFGI